MSTPALANLLAREALTVVQSREATTASFDLKARLLTLPVWEVPQPVTHMLVAHEVGHALYSPADLPAAVAAEWPDAPPASHALLNMFEDIRIDRLVQREYPGTRRDYHTGNWHIWTEGLLGTHPPESLPTLPFPVRALLQHRLGAQLAIPFTPDEQALLPEVLAPRDFAHVVALTRRYWTEATQMQPPPPLQADAPPPPETASSPDTQDGSDSPDDTPQTDGADAPADIPTPDDPGDATLDAPATPASITADPFAAWVRGQVKAPNYSGVDTYILDRLPDVEEQSLRAHPRIDDFTLKLRHEPDRATATDCWRQCAADASVMASAFRRYKAAQQRSKEQYRRTGDLDMQRLHSYRWADDLFKRAVRLPQGQSHALCIAVDFSQSMGHLLGYATPGPLLRQLVTLVEFCRQCHIPYEVYTWTGENRQTNHRTTVAPISDTYVTLRALHLFSSTDGTRDHADALSALTTLWQLHLRPHMARGAEDRVLTMGYTPLAELLLHLPVWVRRFRGIDHVAAIVLTDGEPTSGAWAAACRLTEPATGLLLHAEGPAHYIPHVGASLYQCLWERIRILTNAQCYCYRLCESQREVRRQHDLLTRYAATHMTPEKAAALDSRSAPYHQFSRLWGMDQYLILTPAAFDTDAPTRRTAAPITVTDAASLKKLATSLTKQALAAAKLRPFLTTVGTLLASDLRPTPLSR